MRLLLAVPALALALGLTGCAAAQDAAERVKDCADVVGALTDSGINATPTAAQAREAAERLRKVAANVESAEVKEPLQDLVAAFDAAEAAAERQDAAAARAAADDARSAARATAEACQVPVDQIVPAGR